MIDHTGCRTRAFTPGGDPSRVAAAVAAVLAGTRIPQAAAQAGMDPQHLAESVDTYRRAGLAALSAQAAGAEWVQAQVQWAHADSAEQLAAAHLAPRLTAAARDGVLGRWWFIRKHPHWRLRLQPPPGTGTGHLRATISALLDDLTAAGRLIGWRPGVYEPETTAFGGPAAMDIAHTLFQHDSHAILTRGAERHAVGRSELSVLLLSAMFRAAGQDRYEQGDIWHRVALMRPPMPGTDATSLKKRAAALRTLAFADPAPLTAPGGPLADAGGRMAAFTAAGAALHTAGDLERGLRDVLAHHVIFAWNRCGLPAPVQTVLADAARRTLLDLPDTAHPAEKDIAT
jgi:thiopeptide-type bacteriocin biosynthesis protein